MIQQRIEEVTRANQEFYAAFETLDIDRSTPTTWSSCKHSAARHPGPMVLHPAGSRARTRPEFRTGNIA